LAYEDSDKIKKMQEKLPDIFGQVFETEPSPCKILPFVFLKVAQKFGRIENFAPPLGQGSRMTLVRAVYHDLLRASLRAVIRGVTTRGKGHNYPGAESL